MSALRGGVQGQVPRAGQGRYRRGVHGELLPAPQRQSVNNDLKPPVVDTIDLEIHVCQAGVASHPRPGLAAHSRGGPLERAPAAPEDTGPSTGCAVVAEDRAGHVGTVVKKRLAKGPCCDRSKASLDGPKVESSCSHWRRATADAAAPCHPRTKVEGPSSCKVGAGTPSQSSRQLGGVQSARLSSARVVAAGRRHGTCGTGASRSRRKACAAGGKC